MCAACPRPADPSPRPAVAVTLQGTRAWARDVSFFLTHPISTPANVVYETHVYNPAADFQASALHNALAVARRRPCSARGRRGPRQRACMLRWAVPCGEAAWHAARAGGHAQLAPLLAPWQALFVGPSATLPLVIGEFGPAGGYMTLADCEALMQVGRGY